MFRVAAGLSVTLLLLLLLAFQQASLPAVVRISRALSGEHWYSIEMDGNHAGYLHTTAGGLPDGGWRYSTHTHILLQADDPVNIRKQLDFDPRPPWHMRKAEQLTRRGDAKAQRIRFSHHDGALSVDIDNAPRGTTGKDYTLADFLRVEQWLVDEQPRPDSRIRAPALAFESGRIRNSTYSLQETQDEGFLLRSETSLGPTLTRLDANLLPLSIDVAGVFTFRRTDAATALAIASPAFKGAYLLPVRERIEQPERIESMRLTAVDRQSATPILSIDARRQWISRQSGRSMPQRSLPPEQIERMLNASGLGGAHTPESERVDRLLNMLGNTLQYREGARAESLEAVLERGYGECTDFADVLTALAEKAGMAARTVIGLAYQDHQPYGFAFHAWNEVRVDGTWQAVDPTWGQRFADATHLPLDDQELATLKIYGTRQDALIEVSRIVRQGG